MKRAAPSGFHWVLAGAGTSHLKFLMELARRPIPGLRVTLVSRDSRIAYSAMLPRYLAGDCRLSELQIDLPAVCMGLGVDFVLGEIAALDSKGRRLEIAGRATLTFDAVSLALGAEPAGQEAFLGHPGFIPVKPLEQLLARLDARSGVIGQSGMKVAIAGAGASGCEIALALRRRWPAVTLVLFQAEAEILPNGPAAARARLREALSRARIDVRCGVRVTGARGDRLELGGEASEPFAAVVLAVSDGIAPVIARLGLPREPTGHLRVERNLLVEGESRVFATGDCVAFPRLPSVVRNGVYAVRQGECLYASARAMVAGAPLPVYRPATRALTLLNLADGTALAIYGGRAAGGRWARRWKDSIDRRWVGAFRQMGGSDAGGAAMPCAGCGAKVPGEILSRALSELAPAPAEGRILVGAAEREDAAVHVPPPDRVAIQTVDFFPAFIDEPELFGRLTAHHALSDVYAMNGKPLSALALCQIPPGDAQAEVLQRLLRGAQTVLHACGADLSGGHTIQGDTLALGFAVTGYGERDALFHKRALRSGDVLILVKPVGSGALLASLMREQGRAEWFARLFRELDVSNAAAAQIFAAAGVRACTDITGFGLAGHLREMIALSPWQIRLRMADIPLFEGFEAVTAGGIASTLAPANEQAVRPWLRGGPAGASLFDPQTCGGLVGAVVPSQVEPTLRALWQAGYPQARAIGDVTAATPGEEATIRLC